MITVGLDFGTHQTKVCIEDKKGVETHYKFMKFKDLNGLEQYTLPSTLCIADDGKISYGYLSPKSTEKIIRYFKQAVFLNHDSEDMKLFEAACYSIWYIAYILFDLEEIYGQDFSIQMGAPTDSSRLDDVKAIAVTILASAYRLVEDVFKNNKNAFLNTNYKSLIKKTEIIPYSDKVKNDYGIFVFPEAYACLKPMIGRGKVSEGMSLIIDIGGGTTDISFFTIEDGRPQVYDFFSINKGLNYLSKTDQITSFRRKAKSELKEITYIDTERKQIYNIEIQEKCDKLIAKLKSEFSSQTKLKMFRLNNALKNRPLIYTGGGSMFGSLQFTYSGFIEKHQISYDNWKSKLFDDVSVFEFADLCPILSTAYGLSISVATDNIRKKPFRDLFENIRGATEDKPYHKKDYNGTGLSDFDYGVDDDAWK